MEQSESKKINIKTYVKGTFLFSEDGLEYRERNNQGKLQQKIVQDRIGFLSLQKQIEKEKNQKFDKDKLAKKKMNSIVDKPTLIPIKDTPVEPVPEPIIQNQKCERATQEQFEYFQSYISQRQKQKKFEQAEEKEIQRFLQIKQKLSSNEQQQPQQVNIVFQREQKQEFAKPKKLIKIKIKKKDQDNITKVRVLNDSIVKQ